MMKHFFRSGARYDSRFFTLKKSQPYLILKTGSSGKYLNIINCKKLSYILHNSTRMNSKVILLHLFTRISTSGSINYYKNNKGACHTLLDFGPHPRHYCTA